MSHANKPVDTSTPAPLDVSRAVPPPGFTAWGLCPDCKQEEWLIGYVGCSARSCVPCYWRLHR